MFVGHHGAILLSCRASWRVARNQLAIAWTSSVSENLACQLQIVNNVFLINHQLSGNRVGRTRVRASVRAAVCVCVCVCVYVCVFV